MTLVSHWGGRHCGAWQGGHAAGVGCALTASQGGAPFGCLEPGLRLMLTFLPGGSAQHQSNLFHPHRLLLVWMGRNEI